MAITSVGTLGTGASGTSNSSYTFNTATNTLSAGDYGILVSVSDNRSTTDGATNDHTSVTGLTGTWTKLGEYTNSPGGVAADGSCVSLWMFQASGTVNTGSTVTLNFSGNCTDKTCSFWKFTVTAGKQLRQTLEDTTLKTAEVNGANDYGSMAYSGLTSKERLYISGFGKEANSTTQITASASFNAITVQRSRNNAAAQLVRGEFRINTSTGETSAPTLAVTGDTAGIFAALEEYSQSVTPTIGSLAAVGAVIVFGVNAIIPSSGTAFFGLDTSGATSITPSATTLTLSGTTPVQDLAVMDSAGTVTISSAAPSAVLSTIIQTSAGSGAFTGSSPDIAAASVISQPSVGSVSLSGSAPSVAATSIITGQTGALAISPQTSTLVTGKILYLSTGTLDGWRWMDETGNLFQSTNFDGWIVGTGASNYSAYAVGVERASSTFVDTTPPSGTLDTTLKDAFRSALSYNGTFLAGTWDFRFAVRAVTNASGQDGRVRFRLLKADSAGGSQTELTSGQQACSVLTDVTTTADAVSSLAVSLPAITLSNQYLFVQIAWERTGAATNASADINWRTGTPTDGTRVVTTGFAESLSASLTPSAGSFSLTGATPLVSSVDNSVITPSAGSGFFGLDQNLSIRPAVGTLTFTGIASGLSSGGSEQIRPSGDALTFTGTQAAFEKARITPSTGTLKCTQFAILSWTANTESDLAGYKVYRGVVSGIYTESRNVSNVTTYVWDGLTYGTNYFAITAYDTSDNESTFSSETSIFASGGGWAPTALRGSPRAPLTGSLTLTGYSPTPVTGTGGSGTTIVPSGGALVLSGVDVVIARTPDTATLTLTGIAPTVTLDVQQRVTPTVGTLALTGTTPVQAQALAPTVASLVLTGRTLGINNDLQPVKVSLAFSGSAPKVGAQPYSCGGNWGEFTWGFYNWCSESSPSIHIQVGSLALTGHAPVLNYAIRPTGTALSLVGRQAIPNIQGTGSESCLPLSGELAFVEAEPVQGQAIRPSAATELSLTASIPTYYVTAAFRPASGSLVFTSDGGGTTTISPTEAGACVGNWGEFNWGHGVWCSERLIEPFTTDLVDEAVYYLSVEVVQESAADFAIMHLVPACNINAQLPSAYQAKVDRHDLERMSVEIINTSNDDLVIQSVRPVMNLRNKSRSNT